MGQCTCVLLHVLAACATLALPVRPLRDYRQNAGSDFHNVCGHNGVVLKKQSSSV